MAIIRYDPSELAHRRLLESLRFPQSGSGAPPDQDGDSRGSLPGGGSGLPGIGGGSSATGAAPTTTGFWTRMAPTLIDFGASVVQSGLSARAEKSAAKQQGEAAEKAGALYAPYNARGTQATNTLAALLGMPDLPTDNMGGAVNPRSAIGNEVTGMAVPRGTVEPTSQSAWGPRSLSELGNPSSAAQLQTRSSYGATVKLQAPDGEIQDVPDYEVPHWLKLGARQAVS